MNIFIVIPALNEAASLPAVIAGLQAAGYGRIVVVDDGSTDETSVAALRSGAVVLRHPLNRGMGAALYTGNQFALRQGADIIVHFDADGQMQASDIVKMVQPIAAGEVDMTLGSRFLDKSSRIPWSKRYVLLPISRVVNYFLTGVWLSDAHNGFRAVGRSAAERIVITQDRMAHNSEIVEQMHSLGLRYREVPVTIIYHEYGQSVVGGFKILRDLLLKKLIS